NANLADLGDFLRRSPACLFLSGSAVPAFRGRLLVFVSSKAVRVWQTLRRRSYLRSIAAVLRLHRNLLSQGRPRTQVLQVSARLASSARRRRQASSALAGRPAPWGSVGFSHAKVHGAADGRRTGERDRSLADVLFLSLLLRRLFPSSHRGCGV